ncbi:tetrahydromethanopterin S-methyltransferase subunit MtrC [Candidatus Methanocrinis natronophilus]|uniref:Tetrahydromethanopterin S-methyltransferase subunit C n=1 Tax=Candidatus Methanocrinis natronophilus TaxID=3033396 RepID=A0ABT5X914_9EURY|nr:tetrahydromethanopterin S-methyltransferase subunit C [Candidatus Methanocrinis natronophilus]MDF0591196.1 tetrahydromethanopterin S-methyltransferase subunit C [Candidatus Methanocrinis natronophilus]
MSVAAGGGESKIDKTKLTMYGVGGGILGMYLAHVLNMLTGTGYFSFLAGLGAIAAVVMGADAVRRVCAYGIGTGVPSIGMMAMGMGLVAAMFGLAIAGVAGPIIGVAIAMGFGYLMGILANKVIKMNIPVMEEVLMSLGAAGAIVILSLSVVISGEINYLDMLNDVVFTGYIAIVFIAGALAILQPFNANLGPDETQDRTLVLAISTGALGMFAAGIGSLITVGVGGGVLTMLIAAAIWLKAFLWFFKLVKRDSAGVVGTGLLPEGGL